MKEMLGAAALPSANNPCPVTVRVEKFPGAPPCDETARSI